MLDGMHGVRLFVCVLSSHRRQPTWTASTPASTGPSEISRASSPWAVRTVCVCVCLFVCLFVRSRVRTGALANKLTPEPADRRSKLVPSRSAVGARGGAAAAPAQRSAGPAAAPVAPSLIVPVVWKHANDTLEPGGAWGWCVGVCAA